MSLSSAAIAYNEARPRNYLINEKGMRTCFPTGIMPVSRVSDNRVIIVEIDENEFLHGKYGVATPAGDIILWPQYDYICAYQHGFASMRQNGKWGHLDVEGIEIIPPYFHLDEGVEGYCFNTDGAAILQLYSGETVTINASALNSEE